MATMAAAIIGPIAASNTLDHGTALTEEYDKQEEDEQWPDHKLECEADAQRRQPAANLAQP